MKGRKRQGSSLYHLLQLHPTSHLYLEGLSKRFQRRITLAPLVGPQDSYQTNQLAPQVGPQDTYQAIQQTHIFVKSHSMTIEKTFIQALSACSGLRHFLQFQLQA